MSLLESLSEQAVTAPPSSKREAHQRDQSSLSSQRKRERESSHAKRGGELWEEKEGCENECDCVYEKSKRQRAKIFKARNFFLLICNFFSFFILIYHNSFSIVLFMSVRLGLFCSSDVG